MTTCTMERMATLTTSSYMLVQAGSNLVSTLNVFIQTMNIYVMVESSSGRMSDSAGKKSNWSLYQCPTKCQIVSDCCQN